MGSKIYYKEDYFIGRNMNTSISCDFSNCIVLRDHRGLSLETLKNLFGNNILTLYKIYTLDEIRDFSPPSLKRASLMVLEKALWKLNEMPTKEAEGEKNNEGIIFEFNRREIGAFANVVFNAFNYDFVNFAPSLKLYQNGIDSGKVYFYGLELGKRKISCAAIHVDNKNTIGGLELVSTVKEYQGIGYSTRLVTHIIDEKFSGSLTNIWLFAIEGSVAEAFYSRLGFKTIAKILIWRENLL